MIAEAGINLVGDFDRALKLVDIAADNAEYVKFQSFSSEKLVSNSDKTSTYIDS